MTHECKEILLKELSNHIEELRYMVTRYKIEVNIGVFFCEEQIDVETFKKMFRITDILIQVNGKNFIVVLPYVNHDGARRAFVKVCNIYHNLKPKVALTQINEDDDTQKILKRIVSFYNHAKKDEHYYSIVDDFDILH